ncbi:hypothetical protein KEM52_001324 [Ascosphaera acerosa]|nr:hypothetical protein KEM52_001324 [Ascosphaera acerosa]
MAQSDAVDPMDGLDVFNDLLQPLQDTLTPLQPFLRPVIARLPSQVHAFLDAMLEEPCYSRLVLDLDVTSEPHCLALAVSRFLGLGIVTLSAVVKVPQLVKLLASRSAAGVSFASYALETTSLLVSLAYNARQGFPFTTYGEAAFVACQDVLIALLVLVFSGRAAGAGAFLAAVAAVVYALMFSGQSIVTDEQMGVLQAGAGVLGVASKVPQVYTIWKQGSTGQLSAFAVFAYLFGSLARVFTTVQEVDDKLILYGFLAGFAFNVILGLQMLWYWGAAPQTAEAGSKSADEAEVSTKETASAATATGAARPQVPRTRRRG